MRIITLPLGSTAANCHIVDVGNGKCAVIDPGADGLRIHDAIKLQGLAPLCVLLTHMHFDHIMGVNDLMKSVGSPIPLYVHTLDRYGLCEPSINLSSMAHGVYYRVEATPTEVSDGEVLSIGQEAFKVMHTPGHTPGSVCFMAQSEKVIFTGDTLFQGTVGRTDFPGGDFSVMKSSLKKLSALEGDFTLYPGHGDSTTLDAERHGNPYLNDEYAL